MPTYKAHLGSLSLLTCLWSERVDDAMHLAVSEYAERWKRCRNNTILLNCKNQMTTVFWEIDRQGFMNLCTS
ncbi:hypothetical protein BDP55DRAFT_664790 [Colletotrichum godetiae]|uniref:Uncharacterized protein n=1 Tax=Colletotrichum godetiae TaxID=1209918 RepID=A0AAJ0EVC0_9PEZI|nr:uncharacterized protein BDP55DRAFT_664790 [Colletotrichum godetiae]KAK1675173.1 hypothetical protein BDP55DRAFT_664790 [Colletotrichum godetiae]